MKLGQITESGFYWYFATDEDQADMVQVSITKVGIGVFFCGTDVDYGTGSVRKAEGQFIGPLTYPPQAQVDDGFAERVVTAFRKLDPLTAHPSDVERMRAALEAAQPAPERQGGCIVEIGECAEVMWMQGGPCQLPPGAKLYTHSAAPQVAPIPMVLFCPSCHLKHIDAPDVARKPEAKYTQDESGWRTPLPEPPCVTPSWNNPPHKSHLCKGCGTIWRPADVPTVGVASIKTHGKNDTVKPQRPSVAFCQSCQKPMPHHGDPDSIHLHLCDVCNGVVDY